MTQPVITREMIKAITALLAEYDSVKKSLSSLTKSKAQADLSVYRKGTSTYYQKPLVTVSPAALSDLLKARLSVIAAKLEDYNVQV